MQFLIVDDHEENNYLLKSLLESQNHSVYVAENGKQALDILAEHEIEFIISDILMPIMDGFSLCREVRDNPNYKHIPFVTYTATYTGQQDEDLALDIGADAFIVKPCEPEELLIRINAVIAKTQNQAVNVPSTNKSEEEILKLYNERLVRKLEQKMLESQAEAQAKHEALEALKRSENLLKETQEINKIGGWEWDNATKTMFFTEELCKLHDLDVQCASENSVEFVSKSLKCYPEEDELIIRKAFQRCCDTGEAYEHECWFTTFAGRKLFIRTSGKAIWENGIVTKVIGDFQDITERKQAETDQNMLREQLRQAQKLDSIGQLAGGIAHDFNNILTVILGYAEEVNHCLHPDDPLVKDVDEIIKAGLRASNLTRQLLTFSRSQQVKYVQLNLNTVIVEMQKMLLRLIGEDNKFKLNLDNKLGFVNADLGQIEQIILNLCINARDAMPSGGNITIKTSNFVTTDTFCQNNLDILAGQYVILEVSDTGCGMDSYSLERLFEPFFTTKQVNEGTGLGLSTVYGIVRQAGGHIRVQSEIDQGSCFTIYLPRTQEEQNIPQVSSESGHIKGNNELILIVEDDVSIRDLTTMMIKKLGYRVALAENADKALKLLAERNIKPQVVISDVVMPGISGIEFAAILKEKYPHIKLILMSGYTDKVIVQHGAIDPDLPFIQKPFTRNDLAEKIKQALLK